MPLIPPQTDPRKFFRRHRERGPKRWTYTYKDIADLAHITEDSVSQAVTRGHLDPKSLRSVVRFIETRLASEPMSGDPPVKGD
jgi:hypothetical protein